MITLGRALMIVGVVALTIGGIFYMAGRMGLPLGSLPGDIRIVRDNFTCMIPLATSILLSILLTVVLNLIVRLINR
jgi:hypothetical protein